MWCRLETRREEPPTTTAISDSESDSHSQESYGMQQSASKQALQAKPILLSNCKYIYISWFAFKGERKELNSEYCIYKL